MLFEGFMYVELPDADREQLQVAKNILENPGFAAKITNAIGTPIEKGLGLLPDNWNKNISEIIKSALFKASSTVAFTMKDIPGKASSNKLHKLGAAVSGGVGGFFGITAIAIELPITTSIMIRSIADIARSEGESIATIETKLACLEVFALGGSCNSDDGSESGYFAVRSTLAKSVADASNFLVNHKAADEGAPALVKLITKIAEKFEIEIAEKTIAQAIPAIGAAGGSLINTLFIDHFQDMARGHFIVRRLERTYGVDLVREIYNGLPKRG